MARFEFRLKTLLALREVERDASRSQLAELLAADQWLREQSERVVAELQGELQARRDAIAQGQLDVDRLLAANTFEHSLRSELQALAERQRDLASLVAEQQAALVEAQRQVRVLEKLRERQQQQFHAVQQTAEIRMLDEAGARQARRAG